MAKKDGTEDLRIQRTLRAIHEAFYALMKEKDFEKISVKDIADRAMISRNTFYLHYNDKYDLLNKLCDELLSSLYTKVSKQLRRVKMNEFTVETVSTIIQEGIVEVIAQRESYATLLRGSANEVLTAKLHALVNDVFALVDTDAYGIDGCSMEYIASGLTGVIKYYVKNDANGLYDQSRNFTRIHLGSIIEIANGRGKDYA